MKSDNDLISASLESAAHRKSGNPFPCVEALRFIQAAADKAIIGKTTGETAPKAQSHTGSGSSCQHVGVRSVNGASVQSQVKTAVEGRDI